MHASSTARRDGLIHARTRARRPSFRERVITMNPFTAHPALGRRVLLAALAFALRFGAKMTAGGIAAFVHALLPFCFVTTASRISDELVRDARRVAWTHRSASSTSATMQPLDYSHLSAHCDELPAPLRRRRARQARLHPRRSQRAAGRRGRDHRRHAHPRLGAGDPRRARARRRGDGDLAPGPPHRRPVERRRFAGAGRPRACPSCSGATCRSIRDWVDGGAWHAALKPGQRRAARELPLQQGREKERRRARAEDGAALRCLLSTTPSAPRIAPRPRRTASRSSRRSPARVRCWRPSSMRWARRSRNPARPLVADRRRIQGLDQAHDPAMRSRPKSTR